MFFMHILPSSFFNQFPECQFANIFQLKFLLKLLSRQNCFSWTNHNVFLFSFPISTDTWVHRSVQVWRLHCDWRKHKWKYGFRIDEINGKKLLLPIWKRQIWQIWHMLRKDLSECRFCITKAIQAPILCHHNHIQMLCHSTIHVQQRAPNEHHFRH